MIDGISIELEGFDCRVWENNPRLSFQVEAAIKSDGELGEELGSRRAKYRGLNFVIEPLGKAKIKGSIHKFFNEGYNNATRFTYEDFEKAVNQLSEFGVNPETAILRGFELGLNLDTTFCKIDNKTFLDSILYCRGVERSDMEINGKAGLGYTYKTANTKYKFYDKSGQARIQDRKLLRIETKFTKMRAVENYQIRTLSDLLDREKLTRLIRDKYLKPIDETIFFEWDQIKTPRKIQKKYKSKFKDLRNPNWWIKDKRSRIDRQRNKELLEKLIKKHAKRDIKNILKDLILLEMSAFARSKKCYEYTEFESLKNWNNPKKHATKGVTDTPRIVWCDSTDQGEVKKEKIYCEICGKEIKGNKKSKYCNDQRKCRDKAYNQKVSERRKNKRSKKEKEILKLMKDLGPGYNLIRITNPNRKRIIGIPSRKTSIIVTTNGVKKYFHGSDARFFLNEFDKRLTQNLLNSLENE